MTKSTPLFLLFSVIIISLIGNASAFTDQELTQKYRGATDTDTMTNIQNAINDHSLKCSDLPPTILAQGCPTSQPTSTTGSPNTYYVQPTTPDQTSQTTPTTTTQSDSSGNLLFIILPIIIMPIFIVLLMKRSLTSDEDSTDKPKQPSRLLRYSPFHKKVIRTINDNSADLTGMDDAIGEHDYSNKGMFNDPEIKQIHERMVRNHRMRSLPTSHKLMLSFGLMKEKKK